MKKNKKHLKDKKNKDYRKIKNIFNSSDILKKRNPKKSDLMESKNTPGWRFGGLFISDLFLKESKKKQILFLELFFSAKKISDLNKEKTYPKNIRKKEILDLVKKNNFAISQHSVTQRDKNKKLIGKTFLESKRFKKDTKEYIKTLENIIKSNIFSNKERKYLLSVKEAYSAKNLKEYYPKVWENCDKAYLENDSEYSFNFHGEEDYLDPLHKEKIDLSSCKKNIYKNIISLMIFNTSKENYKEKFKNLDKKIYKYFQDYNIRLEKQDKVEFRNLLLAESDMDYMSADTLPNNAKNGKKIRYNISKIKKTSEKNFLKFSQILLDRKKYLSKKTIFNSRILLIQVHELGHSIDHFSNQILEELKASYLGNYFLLKNPKEIEKMSISEKEYVECNILSDILGCADYTGKNITDIYALGDRIVVYKSLKNNGLSINKNGITINWKKTKEAMLEVGEDLLDFLKDKNFNEKKAQKYINSVGNIFEKGEIAEFMKKLKN